MDGIVGKDGGIFCATQLPICDYIRAGYFLEKGVGIASNSSNVLFLTIGRSTTVPWTIILSYHMIISCD